MVKGSPPQDKIPNTIYLGREYYFLETRGHFGKLNHGLP